METIISDIQTRLTTEVTELKYVDEDWGQLDYYSPNFPVKWPCVLIDIANVQWSNFGNKGQNGLAQVQLKIADIRLSHSSGNAPQSQKDNTASFYLLTQKIFKALHGWSNTVTNHYSALIRLSEGRMQRDDGVKLYQMIFTTQIKDVSASKVLTNVAPPSVKFVN